MHVYIGCLAGEEVSAAVCEGLSVPSAPHIYALCMRLLTVLSAKRFGIY